MMPQATARFPAQIDSKEPPSGENSPCEAKKSPVHRILVVDDEPLIRWWLSESLGGYGYEVCVAEDGCAARRALAAGGMPFDVVLLDFRLPDSNDLALLSRLRTLAPRARFILMTAYGSPEVQQEALDLGAYRVVDKPFKVDEVTTIVSEADNAA